MPKILGQYYAMVSSFDREVGRVLDELERTGADKNTLVVFTSDNGLSLSDHGLIHKSSLYDHDIKLPLIVSGPGIPAGQRSDALVYVSDLLPTVCDLTGQAIPDTVQTKSFAATLKNPATAERKSLYMAYQEEQRAYRDGQYKLALYRNGHTQLFDLKADPLETKDLAKDPAHAKLVADLLKRARQEAKAADDGVIANEYVRWPKVQGNYPGDRPMFWQAFDAATK